jgi:hypothetical protein
MKEEKIQVEKIIGNISGSDTQCDTKAVLKCVVTEEADRPQLKEMYYLWLKLSKITSEFRGRAINFPEVLSESAFCLEMKKNNLGNPVRVIKVLEVENSKCRVSSSFDTFNLNNSARQQIKATCIKDDLTSFGPRSQEDELYFLDFYRDGKFDGRFDVYKIDHNILRNIILNNRRGETFEDQQAQGRRPRLAIKKLIKENKIKPLFTGQI